MLLVALAVLGMVAIVTALGLLARQRRRESATEGSVGHGAAADPVSAVLLACPGSVEEAKVAPDRNWPAGRSNALVAARLCRVRLGKKMPRPGKEPRCTDH